ncbi:MAG: hypothetical protein K8I30_02920 [Anaerolineae bacterium]|nr:hypothetical protein [Anaerolineae bacterium]
MAGSKTRQPRSSFDVKLGDWHMGKVILTSAAARLAEKYDLTPAMIEEMGKYSAGYPIADMRVVKGLVKRGIMKPMEDDEYGKDYGGYDFTALGERLCSQMFAVLTRR